MAWYEIALLVLISVACFWGLGMLDEIKKRGK